MLFDYRTLLESSEDILVTITSRDDRIMETSGAINLLGFTPGEAVGSVHKKFPVGSYYHRQHKSGEKLTCQCLLTADHGQGSFILEKIIKNDYGDTMSSTGSFSFNQAAEDEANRKILLQQTALKEAQIKAQAEIEFTSFLAHEVRNPLSGIDSSIQLLSSTLSTFRNDILSKCSMQDAVSVFTVPSASIEQMRMDIDQGLKDVTHVVSCVKYIQMILTNTLDLAKIDMGKFNLQKTKINLFQDIVSPCLMMLENQKSDRVDVRIECDPEIHITGDPFRLTQAIMNLVENSMRFTKVGYVLLQVRVVPPPGRTQPKKWLPDEGKWIQIRVEDTGPHVPKELQDDVFSKYSVRRYTRQASSVAMSLAKKLFNAMGGDVFMDDQFVSGSAVVVHIPGGFLEAYKPLEVKEVGMYGGVDTADVDTTLVSISTMADGTTETSNPNTPKEGKTTNFSLDLSGGSDRGEEGDESILKHLRVLVVDDSKAACKLLLRRLQSCVRGYWNTKNAVIAHTAEQALELCKTFDFSFDVVIIDQNMQPAGGSIALTTPLLPPSLVCKLFRWSFACFALSLVVCLIDLLNSFRAIIFCLLSNLKPSRCRCRRRPRFSGGTMLGSDVSIPANGMDNSNQA